MPAYSTMNLWNRIKDRDSRADTDGNPYDAAREKIVEYFRPDLTPTVDDKGNLFTSVDVVNGDPAYCARVMTQGVAAGMFNAKGPWRAFRPKETVLRDDNDIRKWCQDLDEIMMDTYAQRESRFYPQFFRYLLSKFTVGSPVLITERHEDRMVYTVPHHKQYRLIRDYFGDVVAVHLRYKMRIWELFEEFPEKEDSLFPLSVKSAMQNGSHMDEVDIIQAFYRAKDPIFKGLPAGDVEIMRHRPWVCLWILSATDINMQEPLRIRYYRSRPYTVGDWDLNPGEIISRTPAWHAMADVRSGQKAWKSQIQLAEVKARPPIWTLSELKGKLNRLPGQSTPVTKDLWQYQPVPFGHEGDYMTANDMWEKLNRGCERWFHTHWFLQLTQMVMNGQAPPTATQIIDMDKEKLAQLSGSIQGIETQDLWPIDDIVFEYLYYEGKIPTPPDRYLEESSGTLVPEFQGPLSGALRLNTMLSRVQTGFSVCAPLFAYDETALLKMNIPDLVERIMEEVGIWEDTIRSKEEYEEIIAGMVEKQERQQAIAESKAGAETVKALSGKTEKTSPLAQMVGK